jgi:hypothetical protein
MYFFKKIYIVLIILIRKIVQDPYLTDLGFGTTLPKRIKVCHE